MCKLLKSKREKFRQIDKIFAKEESEKNSGKMKNERGKGKTHLLRVICEVHSKLHCYTHTNAQCLSEGLTNCKLVIGLVN